MFYAARSASPGRSNASAYQQVHVEAQVQGSGDPHRLVSMLFDGFFESVAQAKGLMDKRDFEAKGKAIGRATAIVDEGLRASLDIKAGGKVAQDLNDLYIYVVKRLMHANLKNDVAALEECARLLQPVKEAWNAIGPQTAAS